MRRRLCPAFLTPFNVMCLYDNVLENNEIVIYECDLAIGPSGQRAECYMQKHIVGHM